MSNSPGPAGSLVMSADAEPVAPRRSSALLTPAFALAAFTGAGLLFVVQPMVARLILPSYGGSATVWSTSSLFFQVLLLMGYLYTHWTTSRLGPRWQMRFHVAVLVLPLVVLPLALPADAAPGEDTSAALWLLRTLVLMIGLPFLVVSTTGPLLQKWYSWTDSRRSGDPYFLFAASNLGSFGGLLAYPLIVEPTLTLEQQRYYWSRGFVAYAVLVIVCGLLAGRSARPATDSGATSTSVEPLGRVRMLRWMAWAFLPSALMLAVTAHITTDVAAVPLLWVIPLAIYLATFVAAFARSSRSFPVQAARIAVALGFTAAATGALPSPEGSAGLEILLQMAMLAAVGFVAHARLSADRPDPAHLTTFYLVIAVGGALGGLLNGLVAPTLFDRVLEYPLVMIAVPLLLIGVAVDETSWLDRLADRQVIWSAVLLTLAGVGGGGLWVGVSRGTGVSMLSWLCVLLLAALLAYRVAAKTGVLVVTLTLLFGLPLVVNQVESLDQSRTFFGSYRVLERGDMRVLMHGTTVHGTQFIDDRAMEPTTYYVRNGPLGAVFEARTFREVGVLGLGSGTIAAYGEPGMRLTYFEIDPEIVRIARTDRLFTFLRDSPAEIDTVVGDGRLKLAEQPAGKFDLLVLDAFSSDAIPIHLLTVEAMEGYATRMSDGGVLLVHVSNVTFDLEPVVANAAAELGWFGAVGLGGSGAGASTSQWVVLSSDQALIAGLATLDQWSDFGDKRIAWTDDHSSILEALK